MTENNTTNLHDEVKNCGTKTIEESLTSLTSGNKEVAAAVIDGVADIPATAYHRGVDTGVINYRTDGGELPSGLYTLRVTAIDEIRERGNHPAIAEMVDANGKVASRQRIELEVFSPEVPAERGFDQAVFSLASQFREDMVGRFTPAAIIVVFWCSNGVHGLVIIR
jgi:hypothetical protein